MTKLVQISMVQSSVEKMKIIAVSTVIVGKDCSAEDEHSLGKVLHQFHSWTPKVSIVHHFDGRRLHCIFILLHHFIM